MMCKKNVFLKAGILAFLSILFATPIFASEAELNIPVLSAQQNHLVDDRISDLLRRNGVWPLSIFQGQETPGPQIHAGYI